MPAGMNVRRLHKYEKQLKTQHRLEISADCPTTVLFVSNSSRLVGVPIEQLEKLFRSYDSDCEIFVFPLERSYSFVKFSTISKAVQAYDLLNNGKHFGPDSSPISLLYLTGNIGSSNISNSFNNESRRFLKGLTLLPQYISDIEEIELINFVNSQLANASNLKNRRVIHFGYAFDYSLNAAVRPCTPIPEIFHKIISKFVDGGFFSTCNLPDQVTVNCYDAGQGIPPHVDTHSAFEETILSLSLKSDVVIEFRHCANSGDVTPILLPRRSLLLMRKDSRYKYKHGILARKYDINPDTNQLMDRAERISITFRKIRSQPCECKFAEFCDWDRLGFHKRCAENGAHIEREYVANVYDTIAPHFDQTRYSIWPLVRNFIASLGNHVVLLDVGCGNGKNLIQDQNDYDWNFKIGLDFSENLVKIARSKNCEVLCADALYLPFDSSKMDAVISIAVIHHFTTNARRMHAIKEILRVLKSGGRACVSVWAIEQQIDGIPTIYSGFHSSRYEDYELNGDEDNSSKISSSERLVVHDGRRFTQQDLLVPWSDQKTGEYVLRYYHLFDRGELEYIILNCGLSCTIEAVTYDQGNWIAVFQKS